MGLFSKIINHTKELTKIANAVENVNDLLDKSEIERFINEDWLIVAWICRFGIIDKLDENNCPMTYKLYVPLYGHHTQMTLHEAYQMSVGRLSAKSSGLEEYTKDAILEILDKGELFYIVDKQIPESKKMIFK